jgi:hypothetical protein
MIAIITPEQRDLLIGKEITEGVLFNVDVKDIDDNYIVGEEEIAQCNDPSLAWIKDLVLSEYKQKPQEPII